MTTDTLPAFETIRLELRGAVAVLTLNRPQRLNAAPPQMFDEIRAALQQLPRNANPIRVRNRCKLTGRPRGYMRQFGISRVLFRKMALEGKIAGVTKASW